jgi:hypothetical protein
MMEKNHLEIISEDIRGKFELLLEGHEVLNKAINDVRNEFTEKQNHTIFLINTINDKIDAVAEDLSKHRADTEVHKKSYRVSETGT